jgi:hypothetical protein
MSFTVCAFLRRCFPFRNAASAPKEGRRSSVADCAGGLRSVRSRSGAGRLPEFPPAQAGTCEMHISSVRGFRLVDGQYAHGDAINIHVEINGLPEDCRKEEIRRVHASCARFVDRINTFNDGSHPHAIYEPYRPELALGAAPGVRRCAVQVPLELISKEKAKRIQDNFVKSRQNASGATEFFTRVMWSGMLDHIRRNPTQTLGSDACSTLLSDYQGPVLDESGSSLRPGFPPRLIASSP